MIRGIATHTFSRQVGKLSRLRVESLVCVNQDL